VRALRKFLVAVIIVAAALNGGCISFASRGFLDHTIYLPPCHTDVFLGSRMSYWILSGKTEPKEWFWIMLDSPFTITADILLFPLDLTVFPCDDQCESVE
jgi:hypothetical protein